MLSEQNLFVAWFFLLQRPPSFQGTSAACPCDASGAAPLGKAQEDAHNSGITNFFSRGFPLALCAPACRKQLTAGINTHRRKQPAVHAFSTEVFEGCHKKAITRERPEESASRTAKSGQITSVHKLDTVTALHQFLF